MELRHFRYALAVADEGSFTRAAERLHIAQQGLSQQVAALEQELGVRLFERTPRGVRPTPAGAAFLAHGRQILAESASAIAELLAPDRLIAAFHARYPGVELELDHLLSRDQPAALQQGLVDVALGLMPSTLPEIAEQVVATPVMDSVFLPAEHPLSYRRTIWLRELASTPMLLSMLETNPYAHDQIMSQLAARGLHPDHSNLHVHGVPTVSLVAVAQAWLLWFGHVEPAPGTVRCALGDPPVTLEAWLLRRRVETSRLVEDFVAGCWERQAPPAAPPLAG
jgi:LysR family transcriptional regulator, hca operon transcriptional activator